MQNTILQKTAFFALTAGVLAASQGVLAHTRLQTPIAVEGTKVFNNAVIGHGCAPASTVPGTPKSPVIANSMVFPDGTDSIISIGGVVQTGAIVDDYIGWGGTLIAHVPSKDVFEKSVIEYGRAGFAAHSPVGSHSWKGELPGDDNTGLVPFKTGGTFIKADSCANSVTFRLAIADVCKITHLSGVNDDHNVNLWMPAVGSKFDGPTTAHGYNSPATFKITRNLVDNPLPATDANGVACAAGGVDVVVDPSIDQIEHDLPIPGIWPKK
jgi:hypothetical protein